MRFGAYCETFGVTPRNRVLEVFLTIRATPLSVEDVIEETGLAKSTASRVMKELIQKRYIFAARVLRGSQLYQLNKENKDVKLFLKAFDALLDDIVEEYGEKVVV